MITCSLCRVTRARAGHFVTARHRRATRPRASTRIMSARKQAVIHSFAMLRRDPFEATLAEEQAAALRLGITDWRP